VSRYKLIEKEPGERVRRVAHGRRVRARGLPAPDVAGGGEHGRGAPPWRSVRRQGPGRGIYSEQGSGNAPQIGVAS
jgi:hypothetical protein